MNLNNVIIRPISQPFIVAKASSQDAEGIIVRSFSNYPDAMLEETKREFSDHKIEYIGRGLVKIDFHAMTMEIISLRSSQNENLPQTPIAQMLQESYPDFKVTATYL